MFGKKKANTDDTAQSPDARQRLEQSEGKAEEKFIYFLLISLAVFGAVIIYLGMAKEFN
ncbi:hypothetical protein [Bacillus sp. NEB1478]|uniref:hypothetical protein n=1 Tax=Bacillus sp. NEB1478 TaxID=3073816 RepID=UPI002872B592|nr:hypothetical protein [Bacillus sp. NEB1478]WNB92411.1 hypothetical protein RGB74_01740 [Bacillus sp. NEB1478]